MSRHYVIPALLMAAVPQFSCVSPTAENDQLAVSLSLGATSVRVAEQVEVRVVAVNHGTHPITVNANQCPYAFAVTDEHAAIVGPESQMCAAISVVREVAPGDSLVIGYNWVPRGAAAWPDAPLLAPGAYQLRGRILARGGMAESQPRSLNVTP